MENNVTIRRMTEDDVELACEASAIWKSARVAPEYMRSFLANERNYLILAIAGGEQVGFVLGYLMQRIDGDRPMMTLYEIEVSEQHRRRGIGSALVREMIGACKAVRALKMFLGTDEDNLPAMALYTSTGGRRFTSDGRPTGFDWHFSI